MKNFTSTVTALALTSLAIFAPFAMAQTSGEPALVYPTVASIIDPVTTQFGTYFTAAIKFSLLAVAGFVAWRYMKKTANKV